MTMPLRQSSIATYMTCARKAQFRYVEGITEPANERMVRGTCAHAGIEFALRRQMTGAVASVEEVKQAVSDTASREASTVDWTREEPDDRDAMVDRAIAYAEHYVTHVAPSLQVVDVERRFTAKIAPGLEVTGTIDIVTQDGLRDVKTTSRAPTPSMGDPRYRIQLGLYSAAWQAITDGFDFGSSVIDFLVLSETKSKGRTVRHLPVVMSPDETAEEARNAIDVAQHVQAATTRGDYPRNPLACFEYGRPCGYLARCMPHRASVAEREKGVSNV